MYCLSPGIRAREERFGLLFYSSKDARLTFVKSGRLLRIEPGPKGMRVLTVSCSGAEGRADRVLAALSKKGLIVELRPDI